MVESACCGNCRFFYNKDSEAELWKGRGMCRRYAPQGPMVAPSSGVTWQVFPPMTASQWCGDYRPNQESQIGAAKIAA